MKKVLMWVAGAVVALVVGTYALMFGASESGEVVVLTTTDDTGTAHSTRIWVVDVDGKQWLRSGSPISRQVRRH